MNSMLWKPKAYQHHRSDPDTNRNHLMHSSNSMETRNAAAPPKWPWYSQKPLLLKLHAHMSYTTHLSESSMQYKHSFRLTLQQFMHIADGRSHTNPPTLWYSQTSCQQIWSSQEICRDQRPGCHQSSCRTYSWWKWDNGSCQNHLTSPLPQLSQS